MFHPCGHAQFLIFLISLCMGFSGMQLWGRKADVSAGSIPSDAGSGFFSIFLVSMIASCWHGSRVGVFCDFLWISDKFPIHFLYISFISPVHFLYISSIFLSYFLPTSVIFPWHFLHIPFIFPPYFYYISLRCPRYVLRISSTAEITNTCLVPSDWTLQGSSLSSTQFPARSLPIPS